MKLIMKTIIYVAIIYLVMLAKCEVDSAVVETRQLGATTKAVLAPTKAIPTTAATVTTKVVPITTTSVPVTGLSQLENDISAIIEMFQSFFSNIVDAIFNIISYFRNALISA
ncbi:hypothetical protein CHUAL_008333 [Chamberlinius hualienensis]